MTARPGSASHRIRIARLVAIALAVAAHLFPRPVAAQVRMETVLDGRDHHRSNRSLSERSLNKRSGPPGLVWSVELGAVGATPFVEDGNGVTTRAGLGPFLGAGVSLAIRDRMSLTAGVRGSATALRVASSGREWRAGSTHQYDFRIGVETPAARHLGIAAAVFAARVSGPADVVPFRSGAGRISVWGAEVAGHVPLARDPSIELLIAADMARFGSQPRENPPVAAGWVGRLRLGVRHVVR